MSPDPRQAWDFEPGRHLAVVGPTASGKSALAMELARLRRSSGRRCEIVSCDSMQVYRGMDIGTAKASAVERDEIPHHLIDIVEPHQDHNLPQFLAAVRAVLPAIEDRGADAILVGGTGLYFRGVVDGLEPPPHFPAIAAELESTVGTEELTRRLAEADPEALARIPPGNRRRLVRALEVTIGTGVPFSRHGDALDRHDPTPFAVVGLRTPREDLTRSINERLDRQMGAGFLAEVRGLRALDPPMSRNARQALGYRELLSHLDGSTTLDEALETTRVRTRRFAIRQMRWFQRDPRVSWVDVDPTAADVVELARLVHDRLWKPGVGGVGATTTVT